MQDLMFAEEPVENREQLLRDNCDQIVERSYTRKFEQHVKLIVNIGKNIMLVGELNK